MSLTTLSITSCQDGYPIDATACDRWCDVARNEHCPDYNPASCVVTCEEIQRGVACYAELDDLSKCVAETKPVLTCFDAAHGMIPGCESAKAALTKCTMARAGFDSGVGE